MAKRMGDANVWVRIFEVSDPTRHRKGFTVYKVVSTVFPKSFPESATKITVWKRYSDFKKLHKELEIIFKQLYLKGEFPEFPKSKVFGRFEHEVVEERRQAALVLLEFTANYLQLFTNKAFIQFFENGYSTQDFLGKILFSKSKTSEPQPPETVQHEISDINIPCLEPQILWNAHAVDGNQEDNVSLSPSSVSSSLSPENPEVPTSTVSTDPNAAPPTPTDLVKSSNSDTPAAVVPTTLTAPASTISGKASEVTECKPSHSESAKELNSSSKRGNGIVRSATVTDDLSSYFDEEFEDAAFLYPTGSCSSLDTLPGFTPSDEVDSTQQKAIPPSKSGGLFSQYRRKQHGFGIFDFLPLFPKKTKKKPETPKELVVEKGTKDLLSVGYICEAAGHFAVAQFHESNTDYHDAFMSYKEGIRVLLAGAQSDTDRDRKLLAKNKLEKYLNRAETLKETYLSSGTSANCNGEISPVFSSPNKKEKCLSSLNKSSSVTHDEVGVASGLEDLKLYKVVGLGPHRSKILIVMNPDDTLPKCYAAKVLWKSSSLVYPEKPNVLPAYNPFMVKLEKWFETSDKIVLLMQHAGGGRLIDFVLNYQSKRLSSLGTPPEESTQLEGIDAVVENNENTHEGKEHKTINVCPPLEVSSSALKCPSEAQENTPCLTNENSEEEEYLLVTNSENDALNCNSEIIENAIVETPPEQSNPNSDLLEISTLLENSKALLQTVSRTLEEERCHRVVTSKEETTVKDVNSSESNCDNVFSTSPIQGEGLSSGQKSPAAVGGCRSRVGSEEKGQSNGLVAEDITECAAPKRIVPEGCIRVWAAEIVVALESLHEVGITYGNFQINDILLGENGHILLRYKSLWNAVDDPVEVNPCTAPEVIEALGVPLWKIHPSADWWSLGVILFWLLTGQSFTSAHPEGIFPDMVIKIPDCGPSGITLSKSAQTLLSELLQYNPEIRLGYYGAAEIKTHPFFDGLDWEKVVEVCNEE